MLLMITALFVAPDANIGVVTDPNAPTPDWFDMGRALGVCLVAVSFTYGGYQQSINFGAEVHDAHRIMPKAIVIGIGLVLILYMTINYAYYRVIGFQELTYAESIGAVMASKIFGESGFQTVSWLLFFSVLGYVNVNLLSNPRVMFAMSEEGTLPASFQEVHPKTKVMTTALSVFTVAALFTLFYAREFDQILNYIMFLDSIGMATSAATIFYFRKHNTMPEGSKEIYKVPLYPILPVFFIAAYSFVALSVFVKKPEAGINGLLIFGAFFATYWGIHFWKKFFHK